MGVVPIAFPMKADPTSVGRKAHRTDDRERIVAVLLGKFLIKIKTLFDN